MPTYDELVELSNGDLSKCIQVANDAIDKTRREHQPTFEKELIRQAYADERLKRLKLAKGNPIKVPNVAHIHISPRLRVRRKR